MFLGSFLDPPLERGVSIQDWVHCARPWFTRRYIVDCRELATVQVQVLKTAIQLPVYCSIAATRELVWNVAFCAGACSCLHCCKFIAIHSSDSMYAIQDLTQP